MYKGYIRKYLAHFLSVGWSVGQSVGNAFAFSMRTAYPAPAQLITAPAQPPATGVAVYTVFLR